MSDRECTLLLYTPQNLSKRRAEVLASEVPSAIWDQLFTRDQLRDFARDNGVPRGRNKADTIANLRSAAAVRVVLEIWWAAP